ncbi:MAG: bifunctional oligoribonuclease/PAP phosphatase NrnA [Erysipelotrichia bacterium]|nr:bifunctional oligoribonuclease/PAP phosphatase NrnA [Erysipelotrichia bacterium]
MRLNKKIIRYLAPYKKEIAELHQVIKRFDRIAIFRHSRPDFDCLGTQFGLATWLKDNFPSKQIKILGDNHPVFTNRLYPETDRVHEDWFNEPFLAIVVDVANRARISDPRYHKATFTVKIDHHPETEVFGDLSIVNDKACAAAELMTCILQSFKRYVFSPIAASYFYSALAGDSGRFQYAATSEVSFLTASFLLGLGIDLTTIYDGMYARQVADLKIMGYILENFKLSPNGVAYYVLTDEILKQLKITTERGKENINLFSNIEGINAWCSVTEDKKDGCWRVSIRSKKVPINDFAAQWGGGGHTQASGAKLNNIQELDKFIAQFDAIFAK